MPTHPEAIDLFDRRRRAWLAEDVDSYLALWADDLRFRSPSHAEPIGRAAFAELVRRSFATARPLRFDVTHIAVTGVVEYRLGEERRGRGWLDYVQGLTHGLGRGLAGFDLLIDSRVPIGGGLASSAALEIAVLRALRGAFGLALDDLQIALVGQQAEN